MEKIEASRKNGRSMRITEKTGHQQTSVVCPKTFKWQYHKSYKGSALSCRGIYNALQSDQDGQDDDDKQNDNLPKQNQK